MTCFLLRISNQHQRRRIRMNVHALTTRIQYTWKEIPNTRNRGRSRRFSTSGQVQQAGLDIWSAGKATAQKTINGSLQQSLKMQRRLWQISNQDNRPQSTRILEGRKPRAAFESLAYPERVISTFWTVASMIMYRSMTYKCRCCETESQ